MATWTDTSTWPRVRAQRCSACIDFTAFTESSTSFTELKSTPLGAPGRQRTSSHTHTPEDTPPSTALQTSLRMVTVVQRTKTENRKVQMGSPSDPKEDDDGRHHDADALQQVSDHVDEGGADAGVAVAAEERVGVAVGGEGGGGAVAALVDLLVAAAVGVEGGGVMEDGDGHYAENHSHYIDDDGAAGGDQHYVAVNLVVAAYDPLDGQIDQSARNDPDGDDGDEGPEDLWRGERRRQPS
ncbi:hypothetical protein EYF80_044378 [Liparis tanakae]|uniref:Uncharacterized protein n=1 Tax=Liparis tanakae TaxID=230148 RepID=A0A4Z2FYK5_9TELE|nr:hypothetical protein EYF80_044378 [Liparis tanakae]